MLRLSRSRAGPLRGYFPAKRFGIPFIRGCSPAKQFGSASQSEALNSKAGKFGETAGPSSSAFSGISVGHPRSASEFPPFVPLRVHSWLLPAERFGTPSSAFILIAPGAAQPERNLIRRAVGALEKAGPAEPRIDNRSRVVSHEP
jgi:hypothetical protein